MVIRRIDRVSSKGNPYHYYTIDGEKADGVTTLLKDGLPKPNLVGWAARSVAEHVADNLNAVDDWRNEHRDTLVETLKDVPWQKRDAAARRGTEVHNLAEKIIHGELVEVPEEIEGHVQACVKFMDDWAVEPIVTEFTVASRQWRYCGTGDGVGKFRGGRIRLWDYKTSASGIWPETAYQLSAYRNAEVHLTPDGREVPMSDLGIEDAVAVWIRSDGYDVIPVDTSDRVFKDFLHIAWVARCSKTNRALVGDPLEVGNE